MVSAVSLEGVSKTYDDFHAVQDVSFEVPAGRITGFLGPNGAGKTSTIRMILGLLPVSAGRITVLGAGVLAAVASYGVSLLALLPLKKAADTL